MSTTLGRRPPPLRYAQKDGQPENPFAKLVGSQSISIIPSFTLESGVVLQNVPVAYQTFGKLNAQADNCMVVCHALTGSADVSDWWGPLLGGPGKAFDASRFFIVCLNCLGSPYGSASPVTYKHGNPEEGHYGPDFPLTTIRDDVNIFKLILEDLGVAQIATAIGGSMGGGAVLEFAYLGPKFVRTIVAIATSARYSAWGISWGEAQRQSIYSDPKYDDGYYSFDDPPCTGLAAARMAALLTYRSRNSFEARFGRNIPGPSRHQKTSGPLKPQQPESIAGAEHWVIHNDGHKNARTPRPSRGNSSASLTTTSAGVSVPELDNLSGSKPGATVDKKPTQTHFSAQSYLRYQGEKFVKRYDANCYIAITRKLDTHDVSRDRDYSSRAVAGQDPLHLALADIIQPALILGIESDGLFTFAEQQELAAFIPNATLKTIDSSEGHDAFLLEFEQVNNHLIKWLNQVLPDIMGTEPDAEAANKVDKPSTSTSMTSEVDEITAW